MSKANLEDGTSPLKTLALGLKINFRLLPPAYVVRREGNSFTLFVCPHLGGVPISHNALQHFPKCHEAAGGGTRSGTPPGGSGYPPRGGTQSGTPPGGRGVRVPPLGGVPGQVPPPGVDRQTKWNYYPGGSGYPPGGGTRSGTPPGGYPVRYPPGGVRVPPRGGGGSSHVGGVPGQDNRRSTHYTAGGMPLAFTQEDFLVYGNKKVSELAFMCHSTDLWWKNPGLLVFSGDFNDSTRIILC